MSKRADEEGSIRPYKGMWRRRLMVGYLPNGWPDVRAVYGKTQAECRKKLDEVRKRHGEGSLPGRDKANVIHFFKAALKRAELSESVRFHDLRLATATLMLAAGVDAKSASQRLGHSTITTTSELYTHVVQALDDQAAEPMQPAMRGAI